MWGLEVIVGVKSGSGVVAGLDFEVVVELLDILICILEFVMSDRAIFEVTVWGDQLMVWLRNRTHVLVFSTRDTLTR